MYNETYDADKRKLLSALSHGSIFFSTLLVSIAVPLVTLIISDDPVVKANAKEALNFHLNVWVYGGIIAFLWFILIGIPIALILIPLFFIFHWVLPIRAIIHSLGEPDTPYVYPFIFRVL